MKNRLTDPASRAGAKSLPARIAGFRKTILWTAVILTLSFLPGNAFENMNLWDISFTDLIVHFFMYAVLTLLILLERSGKARDLKPATLWYAFPLAASAVLGLITELVQGLWITGRDGNIVDFLLNMCGSATVILLYPRIRKIR